MGLMLRPYQQACVDAIWSALRRGIVAPVGCLPTGAGKTPVIVSLAQQAVEKWAGKVLILAHVKELLQQAADSIGAWWPEAPLGVYSAGLGHRDIAQVTVAGIQSVYRRACDLGARDLVIVDEAHLIPQSGEGMYRSLLDDLRTIKPSVRIVGLTATPYRMTTGLIYGVGSMFSDLVYDAGVKTLITDGYLSPLRGKNGGDPDLAGVHRRGGEFLAEELEAAMADGEKVNHACDELARHGAQRTAWLVFCCGVRHAHMVCDALRSRGIHAETITGETPASQRDGWIADYKRGEIRCLVNVNVLTTGFDAPHVDLVAMLRPTCSPGLYYQMIGRGLRKADGKEDCLVLDLAGNINRHGPIDLLNDNIVAKSKGERGGDAPQKTCPECEEVVHAAIHICPACNYEWPVEVARHETKASDAAPISEPPEWRTVDRIEVCEWEKRGDSEAPLTLCVTYVCGATRVRQWVCVEHTGYALKKALVWLDKALMPGWSIGMHELQTWLYTNGEPYARATAAQIAETDCLRTPSTILVDFSAKWPNVVDIRWLREPGADEEEPAYAGAFDESEVPF
jgi:DNA repair protein RadD